VLHVRHTHAGHPIENRPRRSEGQLDVDCRRDRRFRLPLSESVSGPVSVNQWCGGGSEHRGAAGQKRPAGRHIVRGPTQE